MTIFIWAPRGALLSTMRRQWVRNVWRSPTDSTRSLLLTTIFLLIFLVRLKHKSSCCVFSLSFWRKIPLPWSYTSIWESIFCDSPFTLTFDKCSAIPLHFLKKVAHILTFDKSTSIYELISQIGKVLPNFLFSHHHFVQNGKLQTFNFNLMGGSNFRLTKVKNEERAKMFTIDLYGSLTNSHSLFYSLSLFLMIVASINIKKNVQSISLLVWFVMPIIILISMSVLLWTRQKNDRRNSGGTLRQKFNFIDIWFFTFYIWHSTNGPMD